MFIDPIVDELHRIREAHAAQFNHDPMAIFADIQQKQKQSGRTFIKVTEQIKKAS